MNLLLVQRATEIARRALLVPYSLLYSAVIKDGDATSDATASSHDACHIHSGLFNDSDVQTSSDAILSRSHHHPNQNMSFSCADHGI
jgi:hypothetical protein